MTKYTYLESLEKESKEIAKSLHNFLGDLAALLYTSPERLILVVDIWGHWDAVVPVYRLYSLIPGTITLEKIIRPPQEYLLFSADTLAELRDKAIELAEYQEKKKGHLS